MSAGRKQYTIQRRGVFDPIWLLIDANGQIRANVHKTDSSLQTNYYRVTLHGKMSNWGASEWYPTEKWISKRAAIAGAIRLLAKMDAEVRERAKEKQR